MFTLDEGILDISIGTCNTFFNELITVLSNNKDFLPGVIFRSAKQTICGLALLQKCEDQISDEDLTESVSKISGFMIHRALNYTCASDFRTYVDLTIEFLKTLYAGCKTDHEVKRFFLCALSYGGCFEGRSETLMAYEAGLQSSFGLLKFEIEMFKASKSRGDPTDIVELLEYLEENAISLESLHLDRSRLLENADLQRLEAIGRLTLPAPPSLSALDDRMHEAAALYFCEMVEEEAPSADGLKNYIRTNANLSPEEVSNFDDFYVTVYLPRHPEITDSFK
jgi:hypothetical protein